MDQNKVYMMSWLIDTATLYLCPPPPPNKVGLGDIYIVYSVSSAKFFCFFLKDYFTDLYETSKELALWVN